jgi:hypothetical protein
MSKAMNPMAQNPGSIQLTPSQQDAYTARPEDFPIRQYNDPISEPFHGQSKNSKEAQERSREKYNQGSTRALGNVDFAGPTHDA